jgi:hypothetical protein
MAKKIFTAPFHPRIEFGNSFLIGGSAGKLTTSIGSKDMIFWQYLKSSECSWMHDKPSAIA